MKLIPVALLFAGLISCTKDETIEVSKTTYALPDDKLFPEGIAYNSKTGIFYTGSAENGDIVQVDVQTGAASILATGSTQGRASATGMKLDAKNRLWVCGGQEGKIHVLNTDGSLIKTWNVTALFGAGFINDCIADKDYIYFTDSQIQKIYRAKVSDAQPGDIEVWLSFTNQQIPFITGTNANGIEMTADGKYLIVVVSTSGKLYRIDKSSKAILEIQLTTAVPAGDGLLLEGSTLYVSRNAAGKIFPVALNTDFSQGTVGTGFGDNLLFNTTLARAGDYLLVVNGQLNKRASAANPSPGVPTLPFSVSRVSVP